MSYIEEYSLGKFGDLYRGLLRRVQKGESIYVDVIILLTSISQIQI